MEILNKFDRRFRQFSKNHSFFLNLIPVQKDEENQRLAALMEQTLNMRPLSAREFGALSTQSRQILRCFLIKKFGFSEVTLGEGTEVTPLHLKHKRNEELIKFALKAYLKYLCP